MLMYLVVCSIISSFFAVKFFGWDSKEEEEKKEVSKLPDENVLQLKDDIVVVQSLDEQAEEEEDKDEEKEKPSDGPLKNAQKDSVKS